MTITKSGAIARAKALAGFSVNAVHHLTQDDWKGLGHALIGVERTLSELREYWETKEETPPKFNMYARVSPLERRAMDLGVEFDPERNAIFGDDADERGSEG
jgi:hypothetical protein